MGNNSPLLLYPFFLFVFHQAFETQFGVANDW